ncbi:hypothetical protein GCM10010349_77720 [Streptomyces flavofungini]|uniref:Protein-L-isoaspartate O-methyltransferase n=1 Tax=Streptomyces flavofungini TaxID=68200 RepID=A0ABS0XJF3_9ACTN|nr:methyltransferase domain-containing protein [Streptomyces flavofungini]MBJ3813091.1 methyltransferase domain-containing protein [Streptomyces flavofungini]GHC89647.1 hypothetical protein GCM10010349_77720 [Streptomyces flavofungini]
MSPEPGFLSLRAECARALAAQGYFVGGDWLCELFEAVPREAFVPDGVWLDDADDQQRWLFLDRHRELRPWADAVYDLHTPLVTQLDDGSVPATGPAKGTFTSSLSAPSVVVRMLRELSPEPGARILEVATGSGYNAALLSARCGEENVTTVDIDAHLAARAAKRLADAGFHPTVVTGDGEKGYLPGAPTTWSSPLPPPTASLPPGSPRSGLAAPFSPRSPRRWAPTPCSS